MDTFKIHEAVRYVTKASEISRAIIISKWCPAVESPEGPLPPNQDETPPHDSRFFYGQVLDVFERSGEEGLASLVSGKRRMLIVLRDALFHYRDLVMSGKADEDEDFSCLVERAAKMRLLHDSLANLICAEDVQLCRLRVSLSDLSPERLAAEYRRVLQWSPQEMVDNIEAIKLSLREVESLV